jgi:hypothetical protein
LPEKIRTHEKFMAQLDQEQQMTGQDALPQGNGSPKILCGKVVIARRDFGPKKNISGKIPFSRAKSVATRLVSEMSDQFTCPDAIPEAAITPAPVKNLPDNQPFLFQVSAGSMEELLTNLRTAFDRLGTSLFKSRGRLPGRSNLSKDQRNEIRAKASAGARQCVLAHEYGVSVRTVNNIVRGVGRKRTPEVGHFVIERQKKD